MILQERLLFIAFSVELCIESNPIYYYITY